MAVAALPSACPDCAGFGEINGATCYTCEGEKTARKPRSRRWRTFTRRVLEGAATPAGYVVGWSASLPGIGGAAALSYGIAWTAHDVWHPLPLWGVAMVVAGAFGLMADRRLS